MNKLDGIIKSQKDVLSHGCKKNVVYKICCKSCNASYVEQKERKLKARIAQHRNKINSKFGNPSVITEHRRKFGRDFDWESTKILDNERYLRRKKEKVIKRRSKMEYQCLNWLYSSNEHARLFLSMLTSKVPIKSCVTVYTMTE